MGGRGSGRSGRSWLYWIARLWGDISAVSRAGLADELKGESLADS